MKYDHSHKYPWPGCPHCERKTRVLGLQIRTLRVAALTVAAFALILLTTGCTTTQSNMLERAWQTSNLVDMGQTLHIARSPECYYEKNPVTKNIIGRHPSEGEAIAVMLAYAWVHRTVTDQLRERNAPKWVLGMWQVGTLIHSVHTVIENDRIGLEPFGAGCN